MEKPLISVIIPAYNAEKYISDAIESALRQTYKNIEVIVVDDGSTDNTASILKQYIGSQGHHVTRSHVKYIYQENRGPAAARNAGIKIARGEYIAFLDADDVWLEKKLDTQLSFMRDGIGLIGANGNENKPKKVTYKDLLVKNRFSNSSVLVRRECFDKVGLFDERFEFAAEDWDMWLRISREYTVKVINKKLVNIRFTNGLCSPSNAEKMLRNELRVLKKHFNKDRFLKWDLFLKMKTYSSRYFYAGWAYHEIGDRINANRCLLKSFLCNPLNLFSKKWLGLAFRVVFIPFYEKTIKKRKILDYRHFLEASQWWTREKLLEFQWQELKKLLKHSEEQVPYWQKVFKGLGITSEGIKSYSDFQKLPIITKDDIRSNKDEMIARNYSGRTWTKSTGGSTGTPLELDYTPESYDWRVAVSKRGYSWAGCEDGVKQAHIWGMAIGKVPLLKRIKENIHHRLLRQRYFNSFEFDEKKMREALEEINSYKPEIIVGYTNPLYNFARFIKQDGGIKFRPKAVISAAEKLYDFQRKEIGEVFGYEVFNTYGSREFMLIASECREHKGLHINIENLFVEIIKEDRAPAEAGERGEIVITDLHNYGMPFIRYKIGDMAIASDRACTCGRGLPMIEDVIGRSLDMIKTPEGRFVPGEFFPHLMKEFKWVKQFQVVQNRLDNLIIKIVRNGSFEENQTKFLQSEVRKVLGKKIEIDIRFVDEIPLTRTGKFRVTVSNIAEE